MRTAALLATVCLVGASLSCTSVNMRPSISANGFLQTNLVADTAGVAQHTDPTLLNPWGVAFAPGQPFFIADNDRGRVTVVDPSGTPSLPLAVAIPAPFGVSLARPSSAVFNPVSQDFVVRGVPAQFLFAAEDGTVSSWGLINGNVPTTALLAVDDSASGAFYTGIAVLNPGCCREYLALADFRRAFINTYDVTFNPLSTLGSFKDPNLPSGYAPFNLEQFGTQVFITYALQDASSSNPLPGRGNGIVDIFDQEGNFVRRFTSNGPLNAPWGIARASAHFGRFSNDILIGNFGDGTINAFDPTTGNFLGQLTDTAGNVIINPGLWSLTFRNDGMGNPDTLYFTAGSRTEDHGLFGVISPSN